jgi:cytochrome c oxidase subunit 2
VYQSVALQVSLLLMAVVIALFAWVASRAGERADYAPIQRTAARMRGAIFWGLAILFVPIIVYSLGDLPYATNAGGQAQVVKVVGHQWRWEIEPAQVRARRPVEFRVTAADVNHGFAIYDPQLRLVTQTQAMPGYTNVLRHVFDRPGNYKVLCLEYCGLAHHGMVAEITVTSPD